MLASWATVSYNVTKPWRLATINTNILAQLEILVHSSVWIIHRRKAFRDSVHHSWLQVLSSLLSKERSEKNSCRWRKEKLARLQLTGEINELTNFQVLFSNGSSFLGYRLNRECWLLFRLFYCPSTCCVLIVFLQLWCTDVVESVQWCLGCLVF